MYLTCDKKWRTITLKRKLNKPIPFETHPMKSMKHIPLLVLLTMHVHAFCQTGYDSTFVRETINRELEVRAKKIKKTYPIYTIAAYADNRTTPDSVYTHYSFGKEINWKTFNIKSDHGFFTDDRTIDSCLYIHAPLFTSSGDQFKITYEIRYQNKTSYFTTDYYEKKRKKWSYLKTATSFSF